MIETDQIYDEIEAMKEMLDSLANPAYTISNEVMGEDVVTLTAKLRKDCY